MLIEFSVTNFRSIKDKQTLSMVTSKSAATSEGSRCHIETGFRSAPLLTEIAAIYGPNGSGKSNLIQALNFFREFVFGSSSRKQKGDPIDVTPFLFSQLNREQPSEFSISFIHDNYLFEYGFSADHEKVYEEWLHATPQGGEKQTPQTWLMRNQGDFKIGSMIKGEKTAWKNVTRDNALFLSTAVQFESENFQKPFDWICHKLEIFIKAETFTPRFTAKAICKYNQKKRIMAFMNCFDVSFSDVMVEEKEIDGNHLKFIMNIIQDAIKAEVPEELINEIKNEYKIKTIHSTEEKQNYTLDFSEESDGTKKLFALAGPVCDVFDNGLTLVVDEIEASLHPHALQGIISLFQNPKINKKNAQLIFTTHNTNIMNQLSRDQIWFMDKVKFGASELVALSEFRGKADEAFEKRYLGGRYGAIPNIGDLM
jgi:AAA15 family ATPase/GTPase